MKLNGYENDKEVSKKQVQKIMIRVFLVLMIGGLGRIGLKVISNNLMGSPIEKTENKISEFGYAGKSKDNTEITNCFYDMSVLEEDEALDCDNILQIPQNGDTKIAGNVGSNKTVVYEITDYADLYQKGFVNSDKDGNWAADLKSVTLNENTVIQINVQDNYEKYSDTNINKTNLTINEPIRQIEVKGFTSYVLTNSGEIYIEGEVPSWLKENQKFIDQYKNITPLLNLESEKPIKLVPINYGIGIITDKGNMYKSEYIKFEKIKDIENIVDYSSLSSDNYMVIDKNGEVFLGKQKQEINEKATKLQCNYEACLVLTEKGSVYRVLFDTLNEDDGSVKVISVEKISEKYKFKDIAKAKYGLYSYAITDDGEIFVANNAEITNEIFEDIIKLETKAKSVSCGESLCYAIDEENNLYSEIYGETLGLTTTSSALESSDLFEKVKTPKKVGIIGIGNEKVIIGFL